MKYNKNTITEKPMSECPKNCNACLFYESSDSRVGGLCIANGSKTPTYWLTTPTDSPLPMSLNCYWWYANQNWGKLSKNKQEEYAEERRHLLVAWQILNSMQPGSPERREFKKHLHREGGGGLIDFNLYPKARLYYEIIKNI